jgi:uroporphyrin-III C-methyltransferase
VLARLGDFADAVARAGLGSPAIVVIGGVASLALGRAAAHVEEADTADAASPVAASKADSP